MFFDSLDIEEWLPRQERRRAASPRVVNWVEEVNCVTLICEDRRLVVLLFWNQLGIAPGSRLINPYHPNPEKIDDFDIAGSLGHK